MTRKQKGLMINMKVGGQCTSIVTTRNQTHGRRYSLLRLPPPAHSPPHTQFNQRSIRQIYWCYQILIKVPFLLHLTGKNSNGKISHFDVEVDVEHFVLNVPNISHAEYSIHFSQQLVANNCKQPYEPRPRLGKDCGIYYPAPSPLIHKHILLISSPSPHL